MQTYTKFTFVALIFIISINSMAQNLEYGLRYDGIGDNREFFSLYGDAETIIGSRIGFDIGTTIDSIHQFRAGLTYFYEYGSEFGELDPQLILYYSVAKDGFEYKMGAFPRAENIDFPLAFISSRYEYFNPTVDGLLVTRELKNGSVNLFVDWVSRQDSVRREQFMAGFFGKQVKGNFLFDEYFYMFHNAGRLPRRDEDHIEDYQGGVFLFGYDFSDLVPLDILTFKTGVLTSSFRNRGNGSDFDVNSSSYSEIKADYKGFGIESYLKFGNKHDFLFGDSFYNNAERYMRTIFYFTPINFKRIQGRFSWSIHVADGTLDNQQQFRLVYKFGNF